MGYILAFCISVATVPFPFIGIKIFFPLAIIIAALATTHISLKSLLIVVSTIAYMTLASFLLSDSPSKVLIITYCAISLSLVILNFKIESHHWCYIGYIHLIAFSLSIITILVLGYDLLAMSIYGESRHLTGAFKAVSFRGSGLFQEPSTFSYHMLAITLLLHSSAPAENTLSKFVFLIFSLLSFSAAGAVSLIFIIYLTFSPAISRKVKYIITGVLAPIICYIGYIVIDFLFYKIDVYTKLGFSKVTRFEAVTTYFTEFPLLGLSAEALSQYVVYDLGPFVSSILVFGILSTPLLLLLIYSLIKQPLNGCLVLTKIPITDPILWLVIKNSINRKAMNE